MNEPPAVGSVYRLSGLEESGMHNLCTGFGLGLMMLLLAGCAQQPVGDRGYPYYQVPAGSRLILNDQLEIKPGHTRTFVQRGAITDHSDLDQYYPSCSFELRDLKQVPQSVTPDTFVVSRVELGQSQIVALPSVQRLAFNGSLPSFGFSAWDGGEPLVASFYHIWLTSSQQPNVMRLTCYGAMADLSESQRPTYGEIEEALGTVASIEP